MGSNSEGFQFVSGHKARRFRRNTKTPTAPFDARHSRLAAMPAMLLVDWAIAWRDTVGRPEKGAVLAPRGLIKQKWDDWVDLQLHSVDQSCPGFCLFKYPVVSRSIAVLDSRASKTTMLSCGHISTTGLAGPHGRCLQGGVRNTPILPRRGLARRAPTRFEVRFHRVWGSGAGSGAKSASLCVTPQTLLVNSSA